MPTLREQVRLHTTVTSNLDRLPAKKRAGRGKQKSSKVTSVKVDKRVWEKAIEISCGDRKRIQIISDTEVIVK